MKTITRLRSATLLTLPIAVCLLGFSTAVRADEETIAGRFYFSASLGSTFIEDTTLKSSDLFLQSGRVKFTPGGRVDFGFGYHITEWLAAELETGIAINFTDSIGGNGGGGDGLGFYQIPVLANVVYRIPTRSPFKPFIGAGVGGVETQLEDNDLFDGRSANDFGLAWQGFAGVRYQLSSKVELGVVYKYLGATERSFGAFNAKMEGTQTHSVSASISLKF